MRQVRVQGCLPTLAVLLVIAALGAVAFTAGLAVVVATGALLLVLAVGRAVRRLVGGAPPAPRFPEGGVQAVPPGWMEREGGPTVEAGPRDAPEDGEAPAPDGARDLPPHP